MSVRPLPSRPSMPTRISRWSRRPNSAGDEWLLRRQLDCVLCRSWPTWRSSPSVPAVSRRCSGCDVWLIACTYVRPDPNGDGVVIPLICGAIALDAGATAVEARPLAAGIRRPAESHLGREGVFARLWFERIEWPSLERVIMRLDASGRSS
jgi:hypothetical protein